MDNRTRFKGLGRRLARSLGWAAIGFAVCGIPVAPPVIQALYLGPLRAWVAAQNMALLTLMPNLVAVLWGAESGLLLGIVHTGVGRLQPERATTVLLGHAAAGAVAWLAAMGTAVLLSRVGPLAGPIAAAVGGVCLSLGQRLLGVPARRGAITAGWNLAWLLFWAIGFAASRAA